MAFKDLSVLRRGAIMSLVGLLTSSLFAAGAAQNTQNTQSAQTTTSPFQQIKTEFQQLGQDLQSGNLQGAQQDYTTLSQNLSSVTQNTTNPIVQAFNQLGQDLQSGNLQGAQQDFTTIQQDASQQSSGQVSGHHGHHHHAESSDSSSSSSSSSPSSTSGQSSINQAFSALAQQLQGGSLSGAQSAFATLSNDLQEIGGFVGGSSGTSGTAVPSSTSSLNVSA
jgi:hypothetical protein